MLSYIIFSSGLFLTRIFLLWIYFFSHTDLKDLKDCRFATVGFADYALMLCIHQCYGNAVVCVATQWRNHL
jgi:hypothetical protein